MHYGHDNTANHENLGHMNSMDENKIVYKYYHPHV